MALTDANIKELNSMNEAARRANLGDTLKNLESGLGSKSGSKLNEPYVLPKASLDKIGGVKQIKFQQNSSAKNVEELVEDFNSLLAKLKSAGIMS